MNKEEAKSRAIKRIKGEDIALGTIVASESHPLTWKLVRYENDSAVLEGKDGEIRAFPRSEIFDIKKVINVANHYLNLGFWEEGMESTIISL